MFYCHCSRCEYASFGRFQCLWNFRSGTKIERKKCWFLLVIFFFCFYWEMKCSCNYSSLRPLSTFLLWFRVLFEIIFYIIFHSTLCTRLHSFIPINIKLFPRPVFFAFLIVCTKNEIWILWWKKIRKGKLVYSFHQ